MADRTKIEWTDATWNPFKGCSRVSEGCRNCYAERMAGRFAGEGQPFQGIVHRVGKEFRWTKKFDVAGAWDQPLRWQNPRRIFVNSMSDTFYEGAITPAIDLIFAVMALTPQHTYQVLTKRPERALAYLPPRRAHPVGLAALNIALEAAAKNPRTAVGRGCMLDGDIAHLTIWPLPNVWIGTSVENQAAADERIPPLLETLAAKRFLSCEPLLGPIILKPEWLARLDWVIVGGESGPGARPMHPDWVRQIRDQCAAAGVPFFFKQWGAWQTVYDRDHDDPDWRRCPRESGNNKRYLNLAGGTGFHGERVVFVQRRSKQTTGRTLDARTHDAFPGEPA
ncbi:DUF5131 family protein [Elstera sp.]|jgi:protein gp37|uniref:DUF5131 family protein n=1 Tax=Elstera sp. TaxID=1916664 RepID=UPI0037C00698